jgi:hypothetical protein
VLNKGVQPRGTLGPGVPGLVRRANNVGPFFEFHGVEISTPL